MESVLTFRLSVALMCFILGMILLVHMWSIGAWIPKAEAACIVEFFMCGVMLGRASMTGKE